MTYLNDLQEIVQSLDALKPWVAHKRILITGGTGFLGRWLTDSLTLLGAEPTVLTRNRKGSNPVNYWVGDLLDENFWRNLNADASAADSFDTIIHAANQFSNSADQAFEMGVRVFDLAEKVNAKRVLFISSGAVYNSSLKAPTEFSEEEQLATDLSSSHSYAAGKIRVEREGIARAKRGAFEFKIARGFAFFGPHQILTSHFAAAQFFRSLVDQKPIFVQGGGAAIRSYLYPTDFVTGALSVLFRGRSMQPYNLGSKVPTRIIELANAINQCRRGVPVPVQILKNETASLSKSDIYVPKISLIEQELGFKQTINLSEAVKRTAQFYEEATFNSSTRA